MTIYERLFGTPERADSAIEEMLVDRNDICYLMDALSDDQGVKRRNCLYENDPYSCEDKDMTVLEWLMQEVDE